MVLIRNNYEEMCKSRSTKYHLSTMNVCACYSRVGQGRNFKESKFVDQSLKHNCSITFFDGDLRDLL